MPNLPDLSNGDHQWEETAGAKDARENTYVIWAPGSDRQHYKIRVRKKYDKDGDTVIERITELNVTWAGNTQVSGDMIDTFWEQVSDKDKGNDKVKVKAKIFKEFKNGIYQWTRGETPTEWYWDGEIMTAQVTLYTTVNGQPAPITGSTTVQSFSHP